MARRRLEGLERVLGVNALFSTAYGNVGSSIYYALGLVASYALGLTPVVFVITGLFFFDNGLVTMSDVGFAFRQAPARFRSGRVRLKNSGASLVDVRTPEAVLFVGQQIREHGAEARSKRVERWNGAHLGRRYKSFGELRQVYERFVHPSYEAPKYEPSKKREPWQVERDERLRRQLEA